jgi:hypothetical protein
MTEQIENWLSGGPRLLRVHEINVRSRGANGLPTDLISLEVWEGMIRINFAVSVLHDETGDLDIDPSRGWRIDDGHGSEFKFAGSTGGGDGVRMYFFVSFAGTIAADTSELRLTHENLGVDSAVPMNGS